ncbi:MAG TPA: hypothetical protein VK927_10600 [Adhaeribacter sp.]|nr:hypothetical protein [Adhaeribacter sp.]
MKMPSILNTIKAGAICLLLAAATACDSNTSDEAREDDPAGTGRAIVGDDPNLAKPRPAPATRDTAETEEQRTQLGTLPENVDSAARGLR